MAPSTGISLGGVSRYQRRTPSEALTLSKVSSSAPNVSQLSRKLFLVGDIPNVTFIAAPRLSFTVDGREVQVMLGANLSAEQVRSLVREAVEQLNAGRGPAAARYEVFSKLLPSGEFLLGVQQGSSAIEDIDMAFATATRPNSQDGNRVSAKEVRDLFTAAAANVFTFEEKERIAIGWAGLFNGAGWMATEGGQREYSRRAARNSLPVFPVF